MWSHRSCKKAAAARAASRSGFPKTPARGRAPRRAPKCDSALRDFPNAEGPSSSRLRDIKHVQRVGERPNGHRLKSRLVQELQHIGPVQPAFLMIIGVAVLLFAVPPKHVA